jgi:hypothetical protein
MNKIILIEDRPGRQKQFLNEEHFKLLCEKSYLTMPKEEKCRALIDEINLNNTSALLGYSLAIIHRSSLGRNGLQAIDELCNSQKVDLILFSGGLSQLIYTREKYQSLSLNSKDFYNNYLIRFLDKYSQEKGTSLLELIYQSNWKLELLMRYRLLKTIAINEEDITSQIMLEEEINQIGKITGITSDCVDFEINKIITSI